MYQFKLEGIDENWSGITSKNSAPYGNLPSGTYTFKVKAMNSDGYWSKPIEYIFTIRPPWWRTWWAYAIYLAMILFAGWKLHLYQKAITIKKEREKVLAKELEHAQEIEKAYRDLGKAHDNLKSTQAQLIQSEKMAQSRRTHSRHCS